MRKLTTEADVKFELYRILTDLIQNKPVFEGVEFTQVEPERVVDDKKVDLVLHATRQAVSVPLVAVKVRTPPSYQLDTRVFGISVFEQAQSVARGLHTPLFVVTDGSYLRVFRETGQNIGNYKFSCDVDHCERLLAWIAKLSSTEAPTAQAAVAAAPFEATQAPPWEAVGKQSDAMLTQLTWLFNELGGLRGYSMLKDERTMSVFVNGSRTVTLQIEQNGAASWLVLWTKQLRDVAGPSYDLLLSQLSANPGFEWAKTIVAGGQFVIRMLRDIAVEEPDPSRVSDTLRRWLATVKATVPQKA